MATKKKTKTTKTTKAKSRQHEKRAGVSALGNRRDMMRRMADDGSSFLKLSNDNGDNIFFLLHNESLTVNEHWVAVEGGRKRVLCGVHADVDAGVEKIKKGFAPDECPICELRLELYREAKVDPDDPVNAAKKKIANEMRGRVSSYFYAAPGDATSRRVGGKKVLEPFYDNAPPGLLKLSDAAAKKLVAGFEENEFEEADAFGMPVNFIRGKEKDKLYSEVLDVVFFPKQKMAKAEMPDIDECPSFDQLNEYNHDKAQEMSESVRSDLADMIAGEVNKKGKKRGSAGTSKTKSKSSTKRKSVKR